MSGGGAGGTGTQEYKWNPALQRPWEDAIHWAQALTNPAGEGAFKRYPNPRIAGYDDDQLAAMQGTRNFAHNPDQYLYGKGNKQLQGTVSGDYLTGLNANPFVTNNIYEGENPYFEGTVDRGMQKITDAYQKGTAADTTRMFNLSGAFGGSAHQNAMRDNQSALAEQLGNYDQQMRSGQYDRSANLYENYLGRGAGAFEGERGRMMGAAGMSQADQGLTLERMQALMGIGDIDRGMQQDFLNLGYQDWQDENNHQMKMLDLLTGIYGRAQGGVSPNMTQTMPGYQASPFSQLLGAGMFGKGMGFF